MDSQLFIIKSLYVQDGIMLAALAGLIFLLVRSIARKKIKTMIAVLIWIGIVLWFFNTFFGFSTVRISPEGIELKYGLISPRNTVLPIDSKWKIENYLSGIRRNRRLFYIEIDGRQSMRLTGRHAQVLEEIGAAIDAMKGLKPRVREGS
jgi:hypothetical protein